LQRCVLAQERADKLGDCPEDGFIPCCARVCAALRTFRYNGVHFLLQLNRALHLFKKLQRQTAKCGLARTMKTFRQMSLASFEGLNV